MVCLWVPLSWANEGQYTGLNEAATEENDNGILCWIGRVRQRNVNLYYDDKGVVAARTDISTDPDLIATFSSKHAPNVERVVHESGILAIWLTRELAV